MSARTDINLLSIPNCPDCSKNQYPGPTKYIKHWPRCSECRKEIRAHHRFFLSTCYSDRPCNWCYYKND
jgi:predicted Zn-ribbon and HTH transcriptional regulator